MRAMSFSIFRTVLDQKSSMFIRCPYMMLSTTRPDLDSFFEISRFPGPETIHFPEEFLTFCFPYRGPVYIHFLRFRIVLSPKSLMVLRILGGWCRDGSRYGEWWEDSLNRNKTTFRVQQFLGFLVSWFLSSFVSSFIPLKVWKFQSFKDSAIPFHVLGSILIPYG